MTEKTENTAFTPSADCPSVDTCVGYGTCLFAISLQHELNFEKKHGKGSGALGGTLNSNKYRCSHPLSQAPQAEALEFLGKDIN